MARFTKRPSPDDGMPGLFDDFGTSVFNDAGRFPMHPDIKKEAMNRLSKSEKQNRVIFDEGDDFSPLEDLPNIDRLNFISFGSGSSGNCSYIGDGNSGFLIDAGVDPSVVTSELKRYGIPMSTVKGIVLTHDHSDHVRYVYTIVRKHKHIGVYCTPRTLNGILRRHSISNRIKDYHRPIYKEHTFRLGDFNILAFEVFHDGTDNAGFYITHGKHTIAMATDLGCISDRAYFYMSKANYLMIEANYDADMLATGKYPEYLKARISSTSGHLDNKVTAEFIEKIYSPALHNIFLCHLSKDNNTPETALRTVEEALHRAGVTEIGDCSESPYSRMAKVQLMALPRFDSTGLITLRQK